MIAEELYLVLPLYFGLTVAVMNYCYCLSLYHSVAGWQLTVFTLHISPVVLILVLFQRSAQRFRLAAVPNSVDWADWLPLFVTLLVTVFSWLIRRCSVSKWSLGLSFSQISAHFLHRSWPARTETTLVFWNLFVAAGFWVFVLMAAGRGGKTFHKVDLHLRQGFRYVLTSWIAKVDVLRELTYHGALQVLYMRASFLLMAPWAPSSVMSLSSSHWWGDLLGSLVTWLLLLVLFSPGPPFPYPLPARVYYIGAVFLTMALWLSGFWPAHASFGALASFSRALYTSELRST
eukprot:gb/GEZN01015163.1/.p1 GENE.gb/GEZN01015163.1/~~gb/GEZN01015163.1/.p1  ORF type:complete len:289 (-),score=16.38 gb/GEZN01015163.1/:22-888(-)